MNDRSLSCTVAILTKNSGHTLVRAQTVTPRYSWNMRAREILSVLKQNI